MLAAFIDRVGDWNPQLFRELKGQLKPRSLIIVGFVSFAVQLLVCLLFASKISTIPDTYSPYVNWESGVGIVNWALWSGDIFVALNWVLVFLLLTIGSYLLSADLAKEAHQETLNFIRMSPQSASSILRGKVLGVPALLYWGCAIALPLQIASGLTAAIPGYDILGFDAIAIAACGFFYSIAVLIGLLSAKTSRAILPWCLVAIILMYLWTIQAALSSYAASFNSIYNLLFAFHPGTFLITIVPNTTLSIGTNLWLGETPVNSVVAIALGIANFSLWNYWFGQSAKRCFLNPQTTLWSKAQSYWISLSFMAVSLPFALLTLPYANYQYVGHMGGVHLLFFLVCLVAIPCLTPSRSQVQIWARYRPQYRQGIKTFIWDDQSPALLAVVLNALILHLGMLVYIGVAFATRSPDDTEPFFLGTMLACWLSSLTLISLYASIYQTQLLNAARQREVIARSTLLAIVVFPPVVFLFLLASLNLEPMLFWLFTPFAMFTVTKVTLVEVGLALVSQGLAIFAITSQTWRYIYQLGASETKLLLGNSTSMLMNK